ncbi:Glutamine synthetase [bioreactor metagenome]|uniref:Glutamine synthetase n=1 Tax=bioreactor metagenome TaxID=1076179 RepID=A0A645CZB0_9ZZZZ
MCLAAGLDGIEKQMTPPSEVTENIYAMDENERLAKGISSLPGSLEEAVRVMESDPLILDTLGSHVANHYAEGKLKEWEEYRVRVTGWEREKYIVAY